MKRPSIKDELGKIINSNPRRRIPVYESVFSETSQDNYIIASMLSSLFGFESQLQVARSRLGINEVDVRVRHKRKRVISKISPEYMPIGLSELGTKLLDQYANEIRSYYNLQQNWLITTRLAILTNMIFLPPKHEPIKFSKAGAPSQYPAVYLTENVSINQLRKFILANAGKIKDAVKPMQKPVVSKVEMGTILWGQVVYALVRNMSITNDKVFADIQNKLEKIFEDSKIIVPDRGKLRRYYQRYLESSRLIDKPAVIFAKFPPEPEA